MQSPHRVLSLVGRLLLALIFVLSGLMKIPGWTNIAGYMASKGMAIVPILLAATITVEVLGGLSVALGLKARFGAAVLALYLIPVTLIFHDFWAAQGMEQQMQLANFLKNLSIIGGLTLVVALGPGGLSLDERRRTAARSP
jgi:putative oxidoreductase